MDYEHHVIPRHEWKARFGNLEGVNAPENKVRLTREQHAHVIRLNELRRERLHK